MINTFIATHTATREFFTELINASSDSSELWFFDDSFVPMEKLEPIDIIELDYIIQHEFYSAASNGVFIDKDVLYRKAHMWYSYFIHHLSGRTLIVVVKLCLWSWGVYQPLY